MSHRCNDQSLAKILLLDDDDEWRGFAQATLQKAGFYVVAPSNVTKYCSSENFEFSLLQFDLIIIDMFMEGASFVEILQRISQANCGRLTLAIASCHTITTITASAKAGIRNICSKPYRSTALLEEVRSALCIVE